MIGAALGALVAFACFLYWNRPAWFPPSVTHFGLQFDSQLSLTVAVSFILFILLHLLLLGAIYLRPAPVTVRHNSWRTETLLTALATALFLFLAFAGSRIWAGIHPVPDEPGAERIEVYAHQFAWSFRYPGADRKFAPPQPISTT
jgi:cytochrome c oxidase subunit 2